MPRYAYRAVNQHSQPVTGFIVADSEDRLDGRISELGLYLIEAKPAKATRDVKRASIPRRELADFFGGLSTLLAAGIDLSESLAVLRDEADHEGLLHVVNDLRMNIESGVSLEEAMTSHPEVFDPEVRNLIRAGEYSGQLIDACTDISEHLEWVDHLVADVKQASMYPTMVVLAVCGLIFLMFSFVVPQFAEIFESLNLELPGVTKVVVWLGYVTSAYWWAFFAFFVGIGVLLKLGPRLSPEFGFQLDRLKLGMPVFGPLNQLLVLSRFAHNMSLMMKAGVPIVEALGLMKGVVGNRVMELAIQDAEMAVTEGRRMSDGFSEHKVITPIIMRMIVVGEETGRLDQCLEQVSRRMDTEVPRRIKRLFGFLEPLVILILLGIVGFVAAAIFLPLFSLMSGIG